MRVDAEILPTHELAQAVSRIEEEKRFGTDSRAAYVIPWASFEPISGLRISHVQQCDFDEVDDPLEILCGTECKPSLLRLFTLSVRLIVPDFSHCKAAREVSNSLSIDEQRYSHQENDAFDQNSVSGNLQGGDNSC